jgi:GT2 family glycosyltransferase
MKHRVYHLGTKFFRTLRTEGLARALAKTHHYCKKTALSEPDRTPDRLPLDPILIDPIPGLNFPDPTLTPTISIIVPVYNQWKHTWNCLSTIAGACQRYTYEVILADDNSDDSTSTEAPKIANLIIVRDGVNRKFVRNCNLAAASAHGQFLFFLNNDTKCAPHAIDALAEMLLARPEIGIAGSKLIYPDGRLQECGGIVWSDGSAANYGNRQNPSLPDFMHPHQADYVSGAALMIRHDLWKELGGFDDRYAPAYYEDTDLSMAVRQSGKEVWVETASVIIHYEGASNGTDVTTGLKAYQIRNREIFQAKWQEILNSDHLPSTTMPWMAAERPHGRIGILVVDHYIPTPDQDAGSACTRHYLETLATLGHRVIFLGENFVRSEPYTTQLERLGIEAWVGNWHANHWKQMLAERAHGIDIVIFNRPHITAKFLPQIRTLLPQAALSYFGHDLHFLREERAATLLPPGPARKQKLIDAAAVQRQESDIYRQVHTALTISTDEREQITKTFDFTLIETFPGYAFPIRSQPHPIPTGPATFIFVGGFNHHPNQDGVEWFLSSIWPLVREALPDARFWIIGSKMPEFYRTLGHGVEALGRLSDSDLSLRYASCHAVVAPLRYGAGLKGKVIQALAEGLPIITTTVGAEGLPAELKSSLRPQNEPDAFAKAMIDSCKSTLTQSEIRHAALIWAERYYSKAASSLFFSNWVKKQIPAIKCLWGLSHDGWTGNQAAYRLSSGRYNFSSWCPSFHFVEKSEDFCVTVQSGETVILSIIHTESGIMERFFELDDDATIIIKTSRTASPAQVGHGVDLRHLGIKLTLTVQSQISSFSRYDNDE